LLPPPAVALAFYNLVISHIAGISAPFFLKKSITDLYRTLPLASDANMPQKQRAAQKMNAIFVLFISSE